MIRNKIIIVEDDPASAICRRRCAATIEPMLATDGKTALEMIASHCPDLLLLDLGLPDMDGSEIIRSVRSWSRMPIIVISARSAELDKAAALDMGGGRLSHQALRHGGAAGAHPHGAAPHAHRRTSDALADGEYRVGDLCVDYNKHRVYLAGKRHAPDAERV